MTNGEKYDYDLIVIGGGSGGLSCSKAASSLGAKVALFDFVKPSTQGRSWGLGGTCVNVGCVPKKLCHYAGLLGHGLHDAKAMGWNVNSATHDWSALVSCVTDHVKMLNFRYRIGLKNKEVDYLNAHAKFVDSHTVEFSLKGENGEMRRLSAANIVIAVGGRPTVPTDIPGAIDHSITSDDIFFLPKSPGKTLCVGGSYIALECAGFLTELGYDVTVAARSILLRNFDKQCADKIKEVMVDLGTTVHTNLQPTSITKLNNGKLKVKLEDTMGQSTTEEYDTVLFATGRTPDLTGLDLSAAGVKISPNGKIPTVDERTNISHIYAVGDVCDGKQELTPVAVRAGELLAKRMFGGSDLKMDYDNIATTVFTPFEYGCVGLSEEEAIKRYGLNDVEVYMFEFTTLEISAAHRMKHAKHGEDEDMGPSCLSKLVCLKSQNERVVGFHFVGPNAGEVTQGFALAVKLGATKNDFDSLVGIHPTDAESFCALSVTRRSGKPWAADGGCGGGVCG